MDSRSNSLEVEAGKSDGARNTGSSHVPSGTETLGLIAKGPVLCRKDFFPAGAPALDAK